MARKIRGSLILSPRTAPTAVKGLMYFDSSDSKLKVSNDGSTFSVIAKSGGAPFWNGNKVLSLYKITTVGGTNNPMVADGSTRLDTGTTNDNYISLHSNVNQFGNVTFEVVLKIDNDGLSNTQPFWGLAEKGIFDNTVYFFPDGGHSAVFQCQTTSARRAMTSQPFVSTQTTFADSFTTYKRYRIVRSATDVKFYIDGVLKATHTTNLPVGLLDAGAKGLHAAGGTQNRINLYPWSLRVR